MSHVRRARDPHGRARWLLREAERYYDLSAAGLGDELAALGAALFDPVGWNELVGAAPRVGAEDWPLLRPGRPGKALALGKNFAAHAREFGAEPPEELVWFAKLPDVLIGPGEAVRVPPWLTSRVDPEAEVILLLGAPLQDASPAQAQAAVAAYALGNDVTARTLQGEDRKKGWPWLRCKNLATFGPIGPEWRPAGEIPDLAAVTLRGLVNGEVRQEAALADLLWPPAAALAEISRWCPLAAGDIVFLGTPAGVAPVQRGDLMAVAADGLGRLENPVV